MWFWQLKNKHKRLLFWGQLLCVATFIHLILFALVFYVNNQEEGSSVMNVSHEQMVAGPDFAQKEGRLFSLLPQNENSSDGPTELYNKIISAWSAPPGMPEKSRCRLILHIGDSGSAIKNRVVQSSGSLLFDSSAQAAAEKVQYPQWAYGKQIGITFTDVES